MKIVMKLLAVLISAALVQGCISAKSAPTQVAQAAAPAPAPAAVPTAIGDADGDGVNDDLDACPDTRLGVEVDAKGCEILFRFTGPLFDFDKSTLTDRAKEQLSEAASVLSRNPAKLIEIAGHTDSKGSEKYNQALGSRRAKAVEAFLNDNGVDSNRMEVTSYGELQPVASNKTKQGRSENRRVELIELKN